MESNPRTKRVGVYDDDKDNIEQLILNADYQNCIEFCKSAIHRIENNLQTINDRHFMWYLHRQLGDCLYELKEYKKAITIFNTSDMYATDDEYKYKIAWFKAICYKELNDQDAATKIFNDCIQYYIKDNRYDLVFTLKICIADMTQDETLALESVNYLVNYINDFSIAKNENINYQSYSDEAHKTLAIIYYNNGNRLMAYKSYQGIYNKENYKKLKGVILS